MPLIIAGLFLFLPWATALPVASVLAVGTAVIAYHAARALRERSVTGKEALVGRVGEAVNDLSPQGLVRVGGELWVAEAPEPIRQGARVQVVEVSGAKMRVRPWGS
ncbi:MAG: NfeD family protein [Candidatus Rokubacteria bacterium]|nr:NfeD family protein [Candidatus Rokubacteria bacterium]